MAQTTEDVLARRPRPLFMGAKAALESAEVVGKLLQQELNRSNDWRLYPIQRFSELARGFSQPD